MFEVPATNPAKSESSEITTVKSAKRSFDFIVKTTPASVLLKKAAGLSKGSPTPNSEKVGKVSRKQLEEIAEAKMADLNATDMDQAVKIIEGSARSMGIEVI